MDKINILNKTGFLTNEERKQPLEHGCEYFTFKTCLDLSEPIQVIPYGRLDYYPLNEYSRDVASFICWWTHFVKKDLNGFSGFGIIRFETVGFNVTDVKNVE